MNNTKNEESEVCGMTDREYLDRLKDLLRIAETSKDLADFIEFLKKKIDSYMK